MKLLPPLINAIDDKSKRHKSGYTIRYGGLCYRPELLVGKSEVIKDEVRPILTYIDNIEIHLEELKGNVMERYDQIQRYKDQGLILSDPRILRLENEIARLTENQEKINAEAQARYEILRRHNLMVSLEPGTILTDRTLEWLGQHANCPGLASYEPNALIPDGDDPTKVDYKLVKADGNTSFPQICRLLEYLSFESYLDRSLKFPILILLHNGMMID